MVVLVTPKWLKFGQRGEQKNMARIKSDCWSTCCFVVIHFSVMKCLFCLVVKSPVHCQSLGFSNQILQPNLPLFAVRCPVSLFLRLFIAFRGIAVHVLAKRRIKGTVKCAAAHVVHLVEIHGACGAPRSEVLSNIKLHIPWHYHRGTFVCVNATQSTQDNNIKGHKWVVLSVNLRHEFHYSGIWPPDL